MEEHKKSEIAVAETNALGIFIPGRGEPDELWRTEANDIVSCFDMRVSRKSYEKLKKRGEKAGIIVQYPFQGF